MNGKIRIGGVPEHFNLPIHLAIENGDFESRNVKVEWTTFSGGTGQMTKALRNDEVDLCVLLTEGIISDIIKGNKSKLISVYVKTPLCWGIHTGAKNELSNYKDIYDKKYGISRFGSGSHLMPIVDAKSQGQNLEEEQFHVIKNLEGALISLDNLETDVFYWEKYTTKPYVDSGRLKRIGEYVTPWPCFVIAATDKILEEQPENVIRVLRTIHDSCDHFMQNDKAIEMVSERYNQKLVDVERWFHSTEWAIHGWVSNKMIDSITYHLKLANIIDADVEIPPLVWIKQ
ncbi:MAG: ABC transporter substrate-binding protein [Saprospiraceae bacterium]|nr:ABC transporter substrate-binding protein [Bacteroidia bacterium]NNE13778.1 ABC transporter substrate-binding protein [Saprospiraceae bacterium]NNL90678.1 ABC transporter substrate-binding protein [Saprospiraceae bacterium]